MSVSLINGHIDDDVQGMTFEDVKRIRENPMLRSGTVIHPKKL